MPYECAPSGTDTQGQQNEPAAAAAAGGSGGGGGGMSCSHPHSQYCMARSVTSSSVQHSGQSTESSMAPARPRSLRAATCRGVQGGRRRECSLSPAFPVSQGRVNGARRPGGARSGPQAPALSPVERAKGPTRWPRPRINRQETLQAARGRQGPSPPKKVFSFAFFLSSVCNPPLAALPGPRPAAARHPSPSDPSQPPQDGRSHHRLLRSPARRGPGRLHRRPPAACCLQVRPGPMWGASEALPAAAGGAGCTSPPASPTTQMPLSPPLQQALPVPPLPGADRQGAAAQPRRGDPRRERDCSGCGRGRLHLRRERRHGGHHPRGELPEGQGRLLWGWRGWGQPAPAAWSG